jgi:phosphatidylcholine synthase
MAGGVHFFTALGAVCALLATMAVVGQHWEAMFAWLGLALFIDAADGLLARAMKVEERLPRFSGERLDLIVDYLTYVFVPILAMLQAGYLTGAAGLVLAAVMLLASLFHFADTESKAADNSFVGFPAIWNVFAFYVFAFDVRLQLVAIFGIICIVLTFVPLKWVHPVRVKRGRVLTLLVAAAWGAAAVATLSAGFPASGAVQMVLGAGLVYGIALSLLPLWDGTNLGEDG